MSRTATFSLTGVFPAERKTVRITTLAAICHEHVDRRIDFLKIDCEGWEKQALAGADWDRFRPTVVVVEATLPGSSIAAWSEWEAILVETAQYNMVYFDGLNRFYLRQDSIGMRSHFNLPPNYFDEFKLHATEVAEETNDALRLERDGLAARTVEIQARLTSTEDEAAGIGHALNLLEKERDELRGTLGLLEKERAELRHMLDLLEKERDQLRNTLDLMEKERGELQQSLQKARLRVG